MFIRDLHEMVDIMYQYKQKCNCCNGDGGDLSTVRNWGSICGSSKKCSLPLEFEVVSGTHPSSNSIGAGLGLVGGGLLSLQVK